jgi:branched-chain amino acid transport system permease protein
VDRFLFLTVDGLSRGAVYAAFALALVLIWRGTRIVNFAQGVMAVATSYVAYSVTGATGSYWLGFAAALLAGLVLGAVVERLVMRHVEQAPPLNAVIVALGLVLVFQGVLGMIYGNQYLSFPAPFSRVAMTVGGVPLLSRYDMLVFGAVLVLSPTGLGLHPTAMDLVFVSAFTAAVVGGLDSPAGAVVGGLVVGLVLSYVGGYLGSATTPLAVLVLLVAVLLARPGGLFAGTRARRI